MKTAFSLSLLWLAILFSACVPEPVPIEIPQADSKLVVFSQSLPSGVLAVNLTRSFGALDPARDSATVNIIQRLLADSAEVTVLHGGRSDTLFWLGRGTGTYVGIFEQQPGQTYTLQVRDRENGERISAVTQAMPIASLTDLEVITSPEEGDTSFTASFRPVWANTPGEHYYMLNIYADVNALAPGLNNLLGNSGARTYLYASRLYNSPEIRDTLELYNFRAGDTVAVSLTEVSKTYYDYLGLRQRAGSSFFIQFLGEPVNYPSNVNGGYGMFNMHFPSIVLARIE